MTVPIGTILPFGGHAGTAQTNALERSGWLSCNGQAVSRRDFADLFDAIGISFGAGDQTNTFNLPDLRGRFLRGVDNGVGNDPDAKERVASNKGGNAGDAVGSLQPDALRAHSHSYTYYDNPESAHGGAGSSYKNLQGHTSIVETQKTGGNETRPTNIYVNWIIKAKDIS